MMIKKFFILNLCFFGSYCLMKKGFRAKYDLNLLTYGKKNFFALPQNKTAAEDVGWTQKSLPDNSPMPDLDIFCYCDNILCVLFDDTGYVAGFQVAVPKDNITSQVFDLETQGYTTWNTTVNNQTIEYMAISVYFICNETLAKSKENRIATRNDSLLFQEKSIWLTGFHGKLYEVPVFSDENDTTMFTKQNYMFGMGRHYYYNTSASTPCTSETIFPTFLLRQNSQLVGFGISLTAKVNIDEDNVCALESPTETVVKYIVSDGPQCLYDYASSPGIRTLHVYTIDSPLELIWE